MFELEKKIKYLVVFNKRIMQKILYNILNLGIIDYIYWKISVLRKVVKDESIFDLYCFFLISEISLLKY